jgi:hypothetical protein
MSIPPVFQSATSKNRPSVSPIPLALAIKYFGAEFPAVIDRALQGSASRHRSRRLHLHPLYAFQQEVWPAAAGGRSWKQEHMRAPTFKFLIPTLRVLV